MSAPTIRTCPETGLLLLPPGDKELARGLPHWDVSGQGCDALFRRAVAAADALDAQDAAAGRTELPDTRSLEVTLGLLPMPDNEWNPSAVAVIAPDDRTRNGHPAALRRERQISWIRDHHVDSLQPSIVGLIDATVPGGLPHGGFHPDDFHPPPGSPPHHADAGYPDGRLAVGCRAVVSVYRIDPIDIEYILEDHDETVHDATSPSDAPIRVEELTPRPIQLSGKSWWGWNRLRAYIAPWDDVRDAAIDYTLPRTHDRLPRMASHATPWLLPKADRAQHLQPGPFRVTLRATADTLDVVHDGVTLARPHPHPREFFARAHQRVLALGGTATTWAQTHTGSLEVWTHDSRPASPALAAELDALEPRIALTRRRGSQSAVYGQPTT